MYPRGGDEQGRRVSSKQGVTVNRLPAEIEHLVIAPAAPRQTGGAAPVVPADCAHLDDFWGDGVFGLLGTVPLVPAATVAHHGLHPRKRVDRENPLMCGGEENHQQKP